MAGTVTLHIWEHGERADELLQDISRALGQSLKVSGNPDLVTTWTDDVERDRRIAEKTLDEAGEDARLVVSVDYPHGEVPAPAHE